MQLRRAVSLFLFLALAGCGGDTTPSLGKIVEAESQGYAFLEANRLPEAEAAFRRQVKLAPDEMGARINLAIVYFRMGRPRDAEKQLRAAVAGDSSNLDARLLLATAHEESGNRAEARQLLDRLAGMPVPDPKVFYALTELARSNPDSSQGLQEERAALARLTERDPGNVPARLEFAQALARSGDSDAALREMEAFQQLPPALVDQAVPAFEAAMTALRAGNAAAATIEMAALHQALEVTVPFQTDLAKLRGPQILVSGFPRLQMPFTEAMRERLARDSSAPEVRFADASSRYLPVSGPGTGGAALAVGDYDGNESEDLFISAGDTARGKLIGWNGVVWADQAAAAGIDVAGATAASFADFDNDGRLDLFVVDLRGTGYLYHNLGKGTFRNTTAESGVDHPGRSNKIIAADLDHDGDLDLLLATEGGLRFFRNNADGTFADLTAAAGLAGAEVAGDIGFADLDDDGMTDIITASPANLPVVYQNGRERRFERRSAASGTTPLPGGGPIAIGDYNNDGSFDLFLGGDSAGAQLLLNDGAGRFAPDRRSQPALQRLATLTPRSALFFDYDNDGFQDLVVVGEPRAGGPGARLFRNDGTGRFVDQTGRLPADLPGAALVEAADIDRDRDLDLLIAGPAGLRWLRNDGGNGNLAIQLSLTGLTTGSGKNNVFGIGTKLEIRADKIYQLKTVTSRVTLIGLGRHLKVDVIRIEWPNGVPQTLYLPGTDQDVVENQVLKSSCAFLYAWNGTRYEFVTDVMWRSALGMPIGIGGNGSAAYAPAAPSVEYLKLPRGALVADSGRYRIQFTEELWETSYTDQLRLVAVDHPDSVDVVTDERFVPPGAAVHLDLYRTRLERPPLSAVDDQGTDLLPALLKADDRYAANLSRERYQGVVRPHDLIIDAGPGLGEGQVLLLLRGWVFPTDASINVAMSQGRAVQAQWPVLEVKDRNGHWRVADANLSIPSGKNKLVVVDLTGKFPSDDHHVRIRTNLEIYWDQVSLAVNAPKSPVVVTELAPVAADLHYRGFSQLYRKGGRYGPHWFDYRSITREPLWRPIGGFFTRFGDVNPLLQAADDQFIVMAPGDETTVEFSAAEAPPLPAGWSRDFFLYSVGWIKDADLNTAEGGTVGPLPFHGMTRYPYGNRESYPTDPVHRRYQESYNTREMVRATRPASLPGGRNSPNIKG